MKILTRIKKHVPWIFLFTLMFVYSAFFARFHVDPHHDGIILKPAIDVYYGKQLFSQTFTQYGALTTLIHVAFMKICGPTLYAIRLSAVVFYAVISMLLYAIWKRFLPVRMVVVGVIVWILTAYFPNQSVMVPFLGWSSVYSLAFQLFTVLFLFRYLESGRRYWLLATGISTALTFWTRQPVGIFLFGALFIFFTFRAFLERKVVRGLIELAYVVLGAVAVSSIFFVWLAKTNSFIEWYEQSIRLAFNFGSRLSNSFSLDPILGNLFPSILQQKKNIWWNLLPITTLLATFSYLLIGATAKQKIKIRTWQIVLLGIISLASWLQYFPGSDHSHVFWAATPMIGLFLLIIPEALHFFLSHGAHDLHIRINEKRWVIGMELVLLLILSPFIVTTLRGMKIYLRSPFTTLTDPPSVRGMRVAPQEATVMRNVRDRLTTYFSLYPHKYGLNLTPDAFYSLIDPHIRQFHVSPVYWDWATESIWKDYVPEAHHLVVTDRPLVITRDLVFGKDQDVIEFANYCQIDAHTQDVIRIQIYMRPLIIRVPVEDVVSIQEHDEKLTIAPIFKDVRVIRIMSDDQVLPIFSPSDFVGSATYSLGSGSSDRTLVIELQSTMFGSCKYVRGKIKPHLQTVSQPF